MCAGCKEAKPTSAYHPHRRNKDGLQSLCKDCGRIAGARYRQRNRERNRALSDTKIYTAEPKRCDKCKQYLPRTAFSRNASKADGLSRVCTACDVARLAANRHHLKTFYGLTAEQYATMREQQGERCVICDRQFTEKGGTRPCVDHCHSSGKVRAILCNGCNAMLGHAQDSPARLRAAAEYLESHHDATQES